MHQRGCLQCLAWFLVGQFGGGQLAKFLVNQRQQFSSGLRIARGCSDAFMSLLAVGLTTLLAVQAFIIVAGVIRLLPLTGITLPFVSYGGSSLVANYVLLALLMRISDQAVRRVSQPAVVR